MMKCEECGFEFEWTDDDVCGVETIHGDCDAVECPVCYAWCPI